MARAKIEYEVTVRVTKIRTQPPTDMVNEPKLSEVTDGEIIIRRDNREKAIDDASTMMRAML